MKETNITASQKHEFNKYHLLYYDDDGYCMVRIKEWPRVYTEGETVKEANILIESLFYDMVEYYNEKGWVIPIPVNEMVV